MKYFCILFVLFFFTLCLDSVSQSSEQSKLKREVAPAESKNEQVQMNDDSNYLDVQKTTANYTYVSQAEHENKAEQKEIDKKLIIAKNTYSKELQDLEDKALSQALTEEEEKRKGELSSLILELDNQIVKQH